MRTFREVVVAVAGMASGRAWAWLLLLVGGGVSITVNVGHAYIRPAGAAPGWGPDRWAIAWAVLVPLMLFVAVKGITAIGWGNERRWVLWRWCGALPVAGLAGYVSWSHISGLLASFGEDRLVCLLAPLAVDGLMFIGMGGLLATANTTRRPAAAGGSSTGSASSSVHGSRSRIFDGEPFARQGSDGRR
jgi:hypothetical protein